MLSGKRWIGRGPQRRGRHFLLLAFIPRPCCQCIRMFRFFSRFSYSRLERKICRKKPRCKPHLIIAAEFFCTAACLAIRYCTVSSCGIGKGDQRGTVNQAPYPPFCRVALLPPPSPRISTRPAASPTIFKKPLFTIPQCESYRVFPVFSFWHTANCIPPLRVG
jgi:hypothetical protein